MYIYPIFWSNHVLLSDPDSKAHGANMGPIWVLSAPDGPHVGPINFAIWGPMAEVHVSEDLLVCAPELLDFL